MSWWLIFPFYFSLFWWQSERLFYTMWTISKSTVLIVPTIPKPKRHFIKVRIQKYYNSGAGNSIQSCARWKVTFNLAVVVTMWKEGQGLKLLLRKWKLSGMTRWSSTNAIMWGITKSCRVLQPFLHTVRKIYFLLEKMFNFSYVIGGVLKGWVKFN